MSILQAGRCVQHPVTIWLTGLSGAGKTTLACALDNELRAAGRASFVIDGDQVCNGLCKDLGFSPADRSENIRRLAEVAALMNHADLIAIVSCISPYRADREIARAVIGPHRFVEVYVATPLATCEARDAKGLYRRARAGELTDFTGVSAPYEPPLLPAISIDTTGLVIAECIDKLMSAMVVGRIESGIPAD